MANRLFTSESVTEGHPDKLCDQISDAVLDAIIAQDPRAHVACDCATTTGMVLVMGEISTDCYVDIPAIAKKTISDIGYNKPEYGFDSESVAIITSIKGQSPDIAMGVNNSFEYKNSGIDTADIIGAGDQGMMFGFACDETPDLMPGPIYYAHKLSKRLAEVRKKGLLQWLRPDGKTQVTLKYDENGNIVAVDTILISTQHDPDITNTEIFNALKKCVVENVIPEKLINSDTKFYVNPTGKFVIGGPVGDSGLTGRKIIVDTYGGYAAHGGGCFSGKDPTKVDRSAAYMARYIAKNVVAAGLAKKCQIEIAYAIGMSKPVSVLIDTFGTGVVTDEKLGEVINESFDLRPAMIISKLDLLRPIYKQTAAYGHFGRADLDLPWEKVDMIDKLQKL